ncbi:hypothetical protein CBR_g31249 [Chara braunii]|uniref:Calponin-homology (CH) domain-containing protein n=1 Tax=Chara braunii TaxID=69332 RepID=A0A388JY23_CHABU|nr:hypothetical protein CBR_g31249 [Chara braunii]|eukprot:GBG62613.1 hypothetical protein CBR_g31249 [Chara braunii]
MAAFSGIIIFDPVLASQFTQGELRQYKSQFTSLNTSRSDVLTLEEIKEGLDKLALQNTTFDEIRRLVRDLDTCRRGGLDFESFLQFHLELLKQKKVVRLKPKITSFSALAKSTLFIKNLQGDAVIHAVDELERKAYVDHINGFLSDDPSLESRLPLDPSGSDLLDSLKDGILLCKLINVAVPGTIDERALNIKDKLNPWEKNENLTLCLNSAKAIGCSVVNIGCEDILAGKEHLVLGLISQLVKVQLLADLSVKKTPELAELLTDTEEYEELVRLPAEKVLLRWFNFHLKKAGCTREITNFSSDVKDGEAYAILLHALAPEECDLSPLEVEDPLERAKLILANAEKINCKRYVSAKAVVEGAPNLNLAFVAHVFHTRNGLHLDQSKMAVPESVHDDDVEDSREERAFRMWMNSFGVSTYVYHLFEDVRDGYAILEVIDRVAPSLVSWKRVSKPPIKLPFKRIENCNYVVELGRCMKFSLVNIAGKDFEQGNKKLILAFMWQLMRQHMLQLLCNLKQYGKGDVSDADIIRWCNQKVRAVGKATRMESFKDKTLSTGVFFLDLLGAVEPRIVNTTLVTEGKTAEDRESNAKYIISVARKLGCSIFLLWDDIVEVRPKMILTLAASIMLRSLQMKAERERVALERAMQERAGEIRGNNKGTEANEETGEAAAVENGEGSPVTAGGTGSMRTTPSPTCSSPFVNGEVTASNSGESTPGGTKPVAAMTIAGVLPGHRRAASQIVGGIAARWSSGGLSKGSPNEPSEDKPSLAEKIASLRLKGEPEVSLGSQDKELLQRLAVARFSPAAAAPASSAPISVPLHPSHARSLNLVCRSQPVSPMLRPVSARTRSRSPCRSPMLRSASGRPLVPSASTTPPGGSSAMSSVMQSVLERKLLEVASVASNGVLENDPSDRSADSASNGSNGNTSKIAAAPADCVEPSLGKSERDYLERSATGHARSASFSVGSYRSSSFSSFRSPAPIPYSSPMFGPVRTPFIHSSSNSQSRKTPPRS